MIVLRGPFRFTLLGPRGARPRAKRLASLYSRFESLRSRLASRLACRRAAGLIAPPVIREMSEPLLAGWFGSL